MNGYIDKLIDLFLTVNEECAIGTGHGRKKNGGWQSDVLSAFEALSLVGAPAFKVERNVYCDDVDMVGGVPELLPVAVVSYETMQKYIVPREGGFLVPVPTQDNWRIYKLSEAQLQGVIDELQVSEGSSLNDFYRLVSEVGSFWRLYLDRDAK